LGDAAVEKNLFKRVFIFLERLIFCSGNFRLLDLIISPELEVA